MSCVWFWFGLVFSCKKGRRALVLLPVVWKDCHSFFNKQGHWPSWWLLGGHLLRPTGKKLVKEFHCLVWGLCFDLELVKQEAVQ